MKWAVEKCPRWNSYAPRKPRNSKNKSVYSIVGHPVIESSYSAMRHFCLWNVELRQKTTFSN